VSYAEEVTGMWNTVSTDRYNGMVAGVTMYDFFGQYLA
jgi:hypothetical protein